MKEWKQNPIISLYMQYDPVSAFAQGIEGCRDKVFIPSMKNRAAIIKKAEALIQKTKNKKDRIVLQSIRNGVSLFAPYQFINGIGFLLFNYDAKKAPVEKVLAQVKKGIRVLMKEFTPMPVGISILCAKAIDNAIGGIKAGINDEELISLLEQYRAKLGIDYDLNEKNTLKRMSIRSLGRKNDYVFRLKTYDILDTPKNIEKKCLQWIDTTKPELELVVEKIKKKYRLKDMGEIDSFLLGKSSKNMFLTAQKWRKKLTKIVNHHLISISPRHRVKVVATPKYLQSIVAVAGASPINTLAGEFNNYLFLTKEAKINDYFLVDVLIHEEFGHNLNFTNSLEADIVDRIYFVPTTFTAAEVIATYLEYRFFQLSKKLPFTEEFKLLYSYVLLKRLMIVYLRAIADIQINMEKKSFGEFIQWANKKTGVDREFLFRDIMSKLYQPGYAVAYPLGMHLLENLRKKSKLTEKEFNTYVWSVGLPPLQTFLERVEEATQ